MKGGFNLAYTDFMSWDANEIRLKCLIQASLTKISSLFLSPSKREGPATKYIRRQFPILERPWLHLLVHKAAEKLCHLGSHIHILSFVHEIFDGNCVLNCVSCLCLLNVLEYLVLICKAPTQQNVTKGGSVNEKCVPQRKRTDPRFSSGFNLVANIRNFDHVKPDVKISCARSIQILSWTRQIHNLQRSRRRVWL